jgi:hypothetical protein
MRALLRAVAVVMVMAASAVAPLPASASGPEVCHRENDPFFGEDPPGQICLVNPPTAVEPWLATQPIQMRVPADVTRLDVQWRNSDALYDRFNLGMQLLAPGPPGGTSVWQGAIQPYLGTIETSSIPRDGGLTLIATAYKPDSSFSGSITATFNDLPVLALVNGITERIKRRGKRYVATYSANARVAASVRLRMYISAPEPGGEGYDFPGKKARGTASVSSGVIQSTATFSRRYVLNKCRPYRHCTIFAEAFLALPGLLGTTEPGNTTGLKVK